MNTQMLAANADRERTIEVLKAAFAEGRLTQDEYSDRMTRGLAARTYGDLHKLVADLPDGAVESRPARIPANAPQPRARLRVRLGVLATVLLAAVLAAVIAGLLAVTSTSGHGTTSVVPERAATVQVGNG